MKIRSSSSPSITNSCALIYWVLIVIKKKIARKNKNVDLTQREVTSRY